MTNGLGEFLRTEREKRGLTIEQVASATKINVKRILALEADEYSDLPAKPFIRGFVISYCRFLGVDSNDILTQFSGFLDAKVSEHQVERKYVEGYAFERKQGDRGRTILMSVMAGFIVVGALVIILLKPNLRHKRTSHLDKLKQANGVVEAPKVARSASDDPSFVGPKLPLPPPAPAPTLVTAVSVPLASPVATPVSTPMPIPSPIASPSPPLAIPVAAPSAAPSATPQASASPTPLPTFAPQTTDPLNKGDTLPTEEVKQKLSLKSTADVWIRYKIDDKPAMKLFFKKGKLLLFRAKDRVRLQVSNPKAIDYRYNDKGSYKAISEASQLNTAASNPSVVFPPENADNSKDLFPGMAPLQATEDPSSGAASNSSQ